MKLTSMEGLLTHELKDLYNAEKQLTKALPKLAKAAHEPELKQAFQEHLEETRHQIERLDQIFEQLGQSPGRMKCEAMEGLIAEADTLLDMGGDEAVLDAALIGACQRVEHYEIAAYGTARTYAEILGMNDAARLLQETLDEEHKANDKLNQLALQNVNQHAVAHD